MVKIIKIIKINSKESFKNIDRQLADIFANRKEIQEVKILVTFPFIKSIDEQTLIDISSSCKKRETKNGVLYSLSFNETKEKNKKELENLTELMSRFAKLIN